MKDRDMLVQEVRRQRKEGLSVREIARTNGVSEPTVRRWLDGLITQDGETPGASKYIKKGRTPVGGITRDDIKKIRRKTQIGSKLWIKTWKCKNLEGTSNADGCRRRATVIDNTHPLFCSVVLRGGVREEILWVELIAKDRRKKADV